jgi:2-polyprenyl-3-methyl-5-hydroxy-6-metoxy-1,4-benzoquinol methylase
MHLVYRKTCRICDSSALTKVIDLGDQYLQGSFYKEGKEQPPLRKIPMKLMRCDPTLDEKACGLLQMEVSVPPAILYSSYWYRSGTNQTMRNHLRGIADEASRFVSKSKTDVRVLDIGCNDGTLLECYPTTYVKFGIDPSDIAQEIRDNITIVRDTFPSLELKNQTAGKRFDIITSIAMFYDLEDPLSFVREIKGLLNDDGIWIVEMSYMPSMLDMNSYDTICHEHLEYYSFSVLERLMQNCEMKVVKVEFNNINGGSIRCYVTHKANYTFKDPEYSQSLGQLRQQEFDLELDTDKPYKNFQDRINNHKERLSSLLKGLKREGKRIHIYGASTKGNTILQWCGLDHTIIDYAADRNLDKDGAKTIGTDIPIINEEKSRNLMPDYYLVLPWHFRDEFLERERVLLDRGVGFIFPLPEIEVVKH